MRVRPVSTSPPSPPCNLIVALSLPPPSTPSPPSPVAAASYFPPSPYLLDRANLITTYTEPHTTVKTVPVTANPVPYNMTFLVRSQSSLGGSRVISLNQGGEVVLSRTLVCVFLT